MKLRLLMSGVVGLVLAMAMAACGGDDPTDLQSEGSGSDGSTPNYTVIATDFAFSVEELKVKSGDIIIEFDNQGEQTHTFSIYNDAEYTDLAETTGNLNGGERNQHDISLDAGTYFARCDIHPTQMEASVVAE